ncbi:DUF222 domain-containing protein [Candidatus Palauibacter sp.]|uniref:DUF222 domain-containing protein n=1 Tax=Candidatus Palauibacter sp. TaxID=3101350 RepID=UPI003B013D5B
MLHDTDPRGDRFGDPLGNEIAELCAHLDAGQYRLLSLLHRFDREERWSGWRSCAHWLSWRTGISTGPARERVRVARRLASLPLTAAEMESGRLSWSKVRALTRVATPRNEERLVDFALRHTASQVERFVRAYRSAEAAAAVGWDGESELAHRRHLSVQVDHDGMYRIRGRLLPEVGALLMQALDAAGDELYRQEPGGRAGGRGRPRARGGARGRGGGRVGAGPPQAAADPGGAEPRRPRRVARGTHGGEGPAGRPHRGGQCRRRRHRGRFMRSRGNVPGACRATRRRCGSSADWTAPCSTSAAAGGQ